MAKFLNGDELLGGVIYADSQERRYTEFEYRLLLKHGIVSAYTVLVGGIMFWQSGKIPGEESS